MKLLTWNLGYWQHRRHHTDALDYLRKELRPDIALLQEVFLPTLGTHEGVVFKEISRQWGTAIYIPTGKLQNIPINKHPSRVAAAIFPTPAGNELRIASIHGPIINNRVFPHMAEIFDELENLFAGHAAILGGDLNTARLAEKIWPGYGHGLFFQRFEDGPFLDCHWKHNHKEVQTFFRKNQIHPIQDDHLFASRNLLGRVKSCNVLDTPETRRFSDHIPLIAEIDY